MEEYKSRVYALLDSSSRVTRIEGGYTMSNISDISEWTYIDEGTGDAYNLCQSHYLPKPLIDDRGIYRYKYDGEIIERTQEEMDADYTEPVYTPTEMEQLRADVDFLLMMEE